MAGECRLRFVHRSRIDDRCPRVFRDTQERETGTEVEADWCSTPRCGSHQVRRIQFRPGQYFKDLREGRNLIVTTNSPLVDALRSLGFESRDAEWVCSRYEASLLREWIDITIAKQERDGPAAFRRSAPAYESQAHIWQSIRAVPRTQRRVSVQNFVERSLKTHVSLRMKNPARTDCPDWVKIST